MATTTAATTTTAAMARGCRVCFVEMACIALADGSVSLLCVGCDTIGDERHVAQGFRCQPAGMARKPLKLVINRSRAPSVKKIIETGKKSLTA